MVLPAHKVLQDGALPRTLAAHHSDLRQLEDAALTHAAQGILETVHHWNQLLHPAIPHRNAKLASLNASIDADGSSTSATEK